MYTEIYITIFMIENLIAVAVLIGVVNTIYLSWHAWYRTPVKCLFFPPEWCIKVQQSEYSKTLGVPNAYLGLVMYLALLSLGWWAIHSGVEWPFVVVSMVGFLFSTYFTYVQAVILKAFCTWCVLSAVLFDLIMVLMLVEYLVS